MSIIPFSLQCSIQENQLLALKDSENGRLNSAFVSNIPGFKYYLSIFPNGDNDARRGQTWLGLHLELGNVKKVEANFTFLIESTNYSYEILHTYQVSKGRGNEVCKTEEFFNPENKFIVDGKCTIKVNGIFKFENENTTSKITLANQQKWDGGELGNELWEEDDDKDITIFVDGIEIKVHKLVLRTRSNVFKAMFNPKTKESIENKVEIPDFTFEVVETAVKIIYNCGFTSSLSLVEMMSLLQFFDKYQISSLKLKVELLLINQISAATVCRLANASIISNSINLKKKCMKFLEECFTSKTYSSDIEILDKDFLVKAVQNSLSKIVEIE